MSMGSLQIHKTLCTPSCAPSLKSSRIFIRQRIGALRVRTRPLAPQDRVAEILIAVLGDRLLRCGAELAVDDLVASPEALRGKVIVKGKARQRYFNQTRAHNRGAPNSSRHPLERVCR